MDPELKQRFAAIEKKLDEVNTTVSKMHRSQKNARNRKFLYWIIIIGLSIVSYYSIRPYLDQVKETYSGLNEMGSYADLLKDSN